MITLCPSLRLNQASGVYGVRHIIRWELSESNRLPTWLLFPHTVRNTRGQSRAVHVDITSNGFIWQVPRKRSEYKNTNEVLCSRLPSCAGIDEYLLSAPNTYFMLPTWYSASVYQMETSLYHFTITPTPVPRTAAPHTIFSCPQPLDIQISSTRVQDTLRVRVLLHSNMGSEFF